MKIINFTLVIMVVGLNACSQQIQAGTSKTVVMRQTINELEKEQVPGTYEDPWQEALYDTVRVPGAIDPRGIYYRPSHSEVYEIRPEKYQRVQYPEADGTYRHMR